MCTGERKWLFIAIMSYCGLHLATPLLSSAISLFEHSVSCEKDHATQNVVSTGTVHKNLKIYRELSLLLCNALLVSVHLRTHDS